MYSNCFYLQVCNPGYLCRGDDRQGRIVALVPAQDCSLQGRERSQLPLVLEGRSRLLRSHS